MTPHPAAGRSCPTSCSSAWPNARTTPARRSTGCAPVISELSARLEEAQQLVSRLQFTRQTLLEIAEEQAGDPPEVVGGPEPLPPAYQEILAVLTRTGHGMRAKELCRALGTGDQPRHVENMRSKLKRLGGRDILIEPEPGLFAMNRRES
jgi:hypothetical protein